jgi:hypothetical protein
MCLAGLGVGAPASLGQVAGAPPGQAATPIPPSASAYTLPSSRPQPGPLAAIGLGDLSGESALPAAARSAMRTASSRAKATGRAVGIGALTTETTSVAAEPNGKLSLTESLLPVRVRRGPAWVPVNTSLRLVDGRLVPVAVPGSMSFSAGGRGVLAVLGAEGRSISLSWPAQLPAPVVSGPEADYRNVLPGVDLTVTATVAGFTEVLVVHSPAAARNPRLESLRLGVSGTGVSVVQLKDGSLAAVTPSGQTVFTAAPPLMWNSAVPERAATVIGRRAAAVGSLLRSSAAGPGLAARLARAAMRLSRGGVLTIVPSRSMLLAPRQDFPLYIDPTFRSYPEPPTPSYFDGVQQGPPCTDVPYTNNENDPANPDSLGVGYFPSSWGSCYGTQNAYYTMPIPVSLRGAYVYQPDTVFDASEDYSASCSADHDVNLIETDGINDSTDYAHQPTWHPSLLSVTQNGTGIPDTAGNDINCDLPAGTPLGPSTDAEPYAFQVGPAVARALTSPYESSVTFVLTESSQDSSGDSLKRFTDNPSLQIEFDFPPDIPVNIEAGDNSSEMHSCTTSAPYTELGASSGTGVQLKAEYAQRDSENLTIYFSYWDKTAGQSPTQLSPLTGQKSTSMYAYATPVTIPQSALDKMTNGDTVEVQTYSEDIADLDSPTQTCYFTADPHDPGGTMVTMTSSANPPMGTTATFSLAADTPADCTASSFDYELDKTPVSGAETAVTATDGTATVSIVVPAPGVHELFAYANCSNNINPTDTGSAQFTAAGDLALNCASWQAAMTDDCTNSAGTVMPENFDNTMLSGGSGSCPEGIGDGGGRDFDFAQLEAQGWKPNGNITIDGADFTLPDFGSCATDNVLAADQTITTGGSGSALVFLATSTSAFAELPGGTGDPGTEFGSEAAAPPVPYGVGVSGSGCTVLTAFSGTDTGCQPASGTITYTNGTTAPYLLSVPDWVNGPSDIAVVGTADRDQVGGSPQADDPKIYAFAVPLNPALTLASVTLPDVDDTVSATGLDYTFTGLHIFGMSVRNTATATPAVNGTSTAVPFACGCAWTGSFESPIETAWQQSGGFGNQTIRISVAMNVSAAKDSLLRIRLSDPGFLWGDGDGAITIGDATVATEYYQADTGETPAQLHFGGLQSTTLCAGCDVYSDPLTLPFAVASGQDLLISLFIANGSSSSPYPALSYLPGTAWPSGESEWTSAAGTGDHTGDTMQGDFPSSSWKMQDSLLTGVDVTTLAETEQGVPVPGEPTVVVAGDNVIDLWGTDMVVASDYGAPSIRLAGQLASNGTAAGYGMVDAGIESNQVQADSSGAGGVSLLARIDRDVLAEPDVGTVIVDEGLEDLLQGYAAGNTNIADDVEAAYSQLETILSAYGITVVFATLIPCAGYPGSGGSPEDSCPAASAAGDSPVDTARQQTVNGWIGNSTQIITAPYTLEADADCEVSSQGPTGCNDSVSETLASGYGAGPPPAGDWVNLTKAGYAQAAQAVTASDLWPMVFPGSTS